MDADKPCGLSVDSDFVELAVCDADTGEVLRTGRAPHPEGTETHPDRWWDAFLAATADGLLEGVAAIATGM